MSVADYVYLLVNIQFLLALLSGIVGGYAIVYRKFLFGLLAVLLLTTAGYFASKLSLANGDSEKELFPLIIIFILVSMVTMFILDALNSRNKKQSGRNP